MPPTVDNKEQGIHSLPAELICAIFSLIHASRSSPDEKPAALSPVHILNRVCRLWREISQDLPELWTDIRIFHCRTGLPEMLDQYIRRSSSLQLDILLDIPLDVAGKQFVGFWAIILKLWSVAYRWRTLCIITTANNFAHIQANIGCKMVPRLESLQLRVSHAVPSGEIPPSISFSSMSALKSLVLHGIALQNSEVSSFVDQLERLDVNATSTVILLQLAEQFETLSPETQAISRLRYLSLRGSLPPLGVAADSAIKSYTSSLTSLYLGNFDRGDIHALCDVLSASALKELSLDDLSGSCWDDFTGALSVRTIEFPSLRTLKLARIRGYTMHGPGYLAVAFPFLERLSLLHVDCSTFLSSLSKADPIFWPRLNNLTVDNANYRTLRSVVEARSALGCPLASLEVDTPKIIDSSSLHWLQNHVSLKRNLRAA
ncbi:F-box domain-containing protein [Mycena sanguinolenta]|uniref:F-box domain-containing protein n=1 Tax=Mycena sanguinolenta TaxID=230812 RepID=A0A8H7DHJ6_9AGAR|nr:F-box domain-containing protein [Mycena sanguinolenta]